MKKWILLLLCFSLQAQAVEIYQQACRVLGEDDYVQYTVELKNGLQAGSQFSLKLTAFEDKNCQIPYLHYNQYFRVSDLQGSFLNLETQKITYTAVTDEVAEALTLIHYCGVKNWTAGNELAVTGQVCDDYQQLDVKETFFQMADLAQGILRLGKITPEKNGRSAPQRPIDWDALPWTKALAKRNSDLEMVRTAFSPDEKKR